MSTRQTRATKRARTGGDLDLVIPVVNGNLVFPIAAPVAPPPVEEVAIAPVLIIVAPVIVSEPVVESAVDRKRKRNLKEKDRSKKLQEHKYERYRLILLCNEQLTTINALRQQIQALKNLQPLDLSGVRREKHFLMRQNKK